MSNALFAPLYRMESFVRAAAALKSGKKTLLVSGAADTAKIHIAAALADELCAPVLFITSSELKAKSAAEDFSFFFPTHHYPAKDIIFYSADVKSFDIIKQRFSFINGLLNGAGFCAALSVESAFDVLSPRKVFQDFITTYKVGDEIKIADLAEKLVKTGYERAKEADAPGRFSVRGGIVDVYPILAAQACRIEFFDDTIDSLRALDSYGQRSVENIDKLEIFPTRELVYNEEILKGAIQKLEKSYNKARKNFLSEDLIEEAENLLSSVGSDIEKLKEDKTCPNVDKYVAFFGEEKTTLIDYLPPETIIVFDEPARTAQHAENVLREFTESAQARISHGYALPKQIESVVSYNELLQRTKRFRQVILTAMSCTVHDFTIDEICSFDVKSQQMAGLPNLREDLSYYNSAGYFAVVLAGGKTRAERLTEELKEYGLSARTANLKEETTDFEPEKGGIVVTGGSLSNGFEYPLIKFDILSNTDAATTKKKRPKGKKSGKIDSFLDLKISDYVVHDNYGVGIYRGIEKTIVDGISRDYLKISYAAGGNLYVSIHQLSSLQKYIGNSDDGKVKLSKLGSGDWQKAKARVRGAVAILAKDLAEFYAKRQNARGFIFGEDTVWQREFEEEFPFDETDDQLAAIEDTKRDMESIKVMDRLVCGDVGYGKTEIAVRAAFKAVENGKQVAFLAPTTILVQQHCNTFVQRMKNYPIKIESLSR
ncbi:MAG: DEAD/DEAH box helicase, partial [Clostridiales bacterium]|nr:DEAD/DEAH box helicase [Clostridiales bacterium]